MTTNPLPTPPLSLPRKDRIMNATTKIVTKYNPTMPMTEAQFERATYEVFETGAKVKEFGFRIRTISDGLGNARLIGAATRWRNDYDVAVLAVRNSSSATVRVDVDINRPGWSEVVAKAAQSLRIVSEALGMSGTNVLTLILVGDQESSVDRWQPLSALALGKKLGVGDQTANGLALAALERLAECYEEVIR